MYGGFAVIVAIIAVIVAIIVVIGGAIYLDKKNEERAKRYASICEDRGGVVVRMYTPQTINWMQCVKGLTVDKIAGWD